jgi:hypothetical protein
MPRFRFIEECITYPSYIVEATTAEEAYLRYQELIKRSAWPDDEEVGGCGLDVILQDGRCISRDQWSWEQ